MNTIPDTAGAPDLATLLGVSARWLQSLVKQGVLPKSKRGKYPVAECVQAYMNWRLENEIERLQLRTKDSLRDTREAEIAQRMAMRDRELIDIDEHDAVLDEVVGIINAGLVGLPARVTRDRQMRKKIEAEIDRTMNAASARLRQRGEELRASGKASVQEADE